MHASNLGSEQHSTAAGMPEENILCLKATQLQLRDQTRASNHPLRQKLVSFSPSSFTENSPLYPIVAITLNMDSWKKFTNSVTPQLQSFTNNVGPQFQNIGKTFGNLNQQARERFGAVDQEDITELPQEYKDLERRVDALKSAHTGLMKVAKVYETESYDYPVSADIQTDACQGKFC